MEHIVAHFIATECDCKEKGKQAENMGERKEALKKAKNKYE